MAKFKNWKDVKKEIETNLTLEELEEKETEEEREKLILEDTSWFVDKDILLEDIDL